MKLLIITATAIAVFTVNCEESSEEPKDFETGNQVELYDRDIETQSEEQSLFDGPDGNEFSEKETMEENQRKQRKSICKARNACVVMGGFCVTNVTLCDGRLVPEGCKGTNCQCCVPGIFEEKFDNLEEKLLSLKEDLEVELQSLGTNMNNSDSNLRSQLQFLQLNMNNDTSNLNSKLNGMISDIISKLDLIAAKQGCNEAQGFFKHSSQCFKFLHDSKSNWNAAKTRCEQLGLVLAKPHNPVQLRNVMVAKYGEKASWIGAKGSGSSVRWDRDGSTLSTSYSAWYPGHPSGKTSTSYCLEYLTRQSNTNSYPNQPYYMNPCTNSWYPLCELV